MASAMMDTSAVGFQDMMASLSPQNSSSPTAVRKISRSETIHSGHFMVSEIDDSELVAEQEAPKLSHESDYDQQEVPDQQMLDYDLQVNLQECKETTQTYYTKNDGSVLIDGSFTKLFECMSLAYSGKITSPRWKTFKGLKLKLKDKIRLNNIIWRAWHIQYISGRKPMVCQFSSPIDADTHKKPETVVLEGKYWKRRLASVTAEYQKWRMYYRKIGRPQTPTRPSYFDWENRWPVWSTNSMSGFSSNDDYSMDFTDSLFTTLLQPNLIDFPNPREIARSGMGAEFMQPGLVQLQPTLDDFMDTFEPLQELFFQSSNLKTVSSLPTLPEETTVDYTNANVADNSKICDSISEVSSQIDSVILNTLLNQSQSANVASLQTMPSNVMKESILESNATNEPQINAELDLEFKRENANKQMQDHMYTHFVSSPVGQQRDVPLQQSQSPVHTIIHSGNREPLSYNDFAQNNHSYSQYQICEPSQATNNVKSNLVKQKYVELDSPENNVEKFAVPKSIPIKQRSRSRSISSPQINNESIQSIIVMPPQSAVSLTDIHSLRTNNVERSNSLPVYTHERRKGVVSMPKLLNNSDGMVYASNAHQQSQHNAKLQLNASQPSHHSSSLPSVSAYSQNTIQNANHTILSNSYNTLTQGNTGSTLIARLLSSPTNINHITSAAHIYPKNVSSSAMNITNTSHIRQTTIDASCIGINTPHNHASNSDAAKPQPLLLNAFKEANATLTGLQQNFKPKMVVPSSTTPQISSMPSHLKSRLSTASPKEAFPTNMPLTPSPPMLSSPLKVNKSKSVEDRMQYREHRRVCHINAEQKRRCNIKNGFDTLRCLLPSVSHSTNTKISKAAMLQKAADYIRALKSERQSQQDEYDTLKQQIESLNQTIGVFQNQLPATGAPISCQRANHSKELYDDYVKRRTLENWKFWIFSIIIESLLESYNSTVATSNVDEMCKTLLRWLDQNCCLVTLRRDVLQSLRYLCTSTNILTNPSSLPEEAVLAVTKKEKQHTS